MAISLLLISMGFVGNAHSAGFAVTRLTSYLAFFSVGMGPGAWLIPSEVSSTLIRAKAMSVATFMNHITATLMASSFQTRATAAHYCVAGCRVNDLNSSKYNNIVMGGGV